MKKRILTSVCSILLVITMLMPSVPFSVFATETGDIVTDDSTQTEPVVEVTDVASADELELALSAGAGAIRITADFTLDRTYYITHDVNIFSDEAHTLTRHPDFGGDIFVVGEGADGTATEETVVLALGNKTSDSKDLLTIDGNSGNMVATVSGSVIFLCAKGQADLYKSLTVINNKKIANERALLEVHGLSYPDTVGGAVAIITKGSIMNIYGGTYKNNHVNTETSSIYGGAFYNFSTLNIFDGCFEGNSAVRAGVVYNYRTLNILSGEFRNNSASAMGGAVYAPASTGSFTYIGTDSNSAEGGNTVFAGNSAENGGAILCQATMTVVNASFTENSATEAGGAFYISNKANIVVDNTTFAGNTSGTAGGAVYCKGSMLEIADSIFEKNCSGTHGGAVAITEQSEESETVELLIKNTKFSENKATSHGGGLYLTSEARAYLSKVNFISNEATTASSSSTGGAIYCNASTLEYNRGELKLNKGYNGGAVYLAASSTATFNKITATENTSASLGGFLYSLGTLNMYNSTLTSNTGASGGGMYLYTNAVSNIYNSVFDGNKATSSSGAGGGLFIYTSSTNTLLHSNTFRNNTAGNYGGALQISGVSLVDMYNTTATGNSASKGGFLYETKAGTTVTIAGVTLSGNTADSGPIIFGNTANAILNIDKSQYTDSDTEGALDDAYWSGAIANKLTVNEVAVEIPDYTEYEQPEYDTDISSEVRSALQLERALAAGHTSIIITRDFEIDRTYYITQDVNIYTEEAHTLTRSSAFTGDIFVVGESADGTPTESKVTLTLGNKISDTASLLTIDGNSENIAEAVSGTVIFLCANGNADLYENITIINHKKTANERTLLEVHGLSYPDTVGGAVAILTKGSVMNIYGGIYKNNSVNLTGDSLYGGAFYNFSTLNIYGGTFEGNSANRAGAIYNYRTLNIHAGEFKGNTASTMGGVIYGPASTGSFTNIGTKTEASDTPLIIFSGNSATDGGAILCQATMDIRNTLFDSNTCKETGAALHNVNKSNTTIANCIFTNNISGTAGGAIYNGGSITEITDSVFSNNKSGTHGGAIYSSSASTETDKYDLIVKGTEFAGNSSDSNGAALYLTGGNRAHLEDVKFISNYGSSTSYGGAIYTSGSTLDIDGAEFTDNSALSGGAIMLNTSSTATFNNITATDNSATKYGGFLYTNTSSFNIYNSKVEYNNAQSGGAVFINTSSEAGIYATEFGFNTATSQGGALYISTMGATATIHSCTFDSNDAANYGGAVYATKESIVNLYNTTATANSASRGGMMYIATYGTEVTVNGLTTDGNSASILGDIIYGNSANAVLNINKNNYTDKNTDALDSDYWKSALSGRLTINEIDEKIPSYIEYGNESSGSITEYCDAASSEELEKAILSGEKFIRITEDFLIDRTFYISNETTIFSTKSITLTRHPDFGGDIFVVGENADHTSALLLGANAKLTLGNPSSETESLLIIDGNKDNMNVPTTGTVIFICYSSVVKLYDNLTVRNCNKNSNEKVYDTAYGLVGANRIGGPLAIVGSGTLSIYGGLYEDNIICEEDTSSEATRISTYGGLIYNTSNLRIYDGTFRNNQGARGGLLYNYRITEIYGGTFESNHATVSGGVVYSPSSAASHLIIGSDTPSETPIIIKNNTAEDNGGAIYSPVMCALVIKNATIEGNRSLTSNGGAICVYGQFTARNVEFIGNKAKYRGGAVYASNNANDYVTRYVNFTDCTFTENTAVLGGAISVYSSSMDYNNGGIVTISDCEFNSNSAAKQKATSSEAFGGAIYADRKSSVTVDRSFFNSNTADISGGAVYLKGLSTADFNHCEFTENKAIDETASGGAVTVNSAYCDIFCTDFYDNSATLSGGAVSLTYTESLAVNSEVNITDSLLSGNSAENGGGIHAVDYLVDSDTCTLTAVNTEFASNSATRGGAIYLADNADAYLRDIYFSRNNADAGGAFYTKGGIAEFDTAVFDKNTSDGSGGGVYLSDNSVTVMNNITATGNKADGNGGFLYSTGGTLSIYDSYIDANSAASGGGMYLYTSAVSNIYHCVFNANNAAADSGNGGALFIYTSGTDTLLHSNTFRNNKAVSYGGALQISGTSPVYIYNTIAADNSAAYGGFMYETKAGTEVTLASLILSGNTATKAGPIIYGNTFNAVLNIDKAQYNDTDLTGEADDNYWAEAIVNKLTVNDVTVQIPEYDDYVSRDDSVTPPEQEKTPVSVQDVLSLGLSSSDASINSTYNKLPRLDNSSNFMSRSTAYYPNINGNTVSVDTFVYHENHTAHNGNVGEGLLIYQAILYKEAHPEEEVYIDISSYRFSVQAAVNINRNSRYFGYMRDLKEKDYDQYGFVKIAYLLVTAAKMGIHVNVIGQLDAYPVTSKALNFYDYFTTKLSDPCDPDYTQGVIGDYLDFNFCYWNLSEKGGTDMMHTKLCAVSHYLDMNGEEHRNAVWTSSANLDGVRSSGVNGNWKQQTASIVSDHEEIYRISYNYLQLISDYCGQEEIYEWQNLVNTRNEQQIDLILAGREDEIPADEKLVYIGSETDDVFEFYFTPLGGGAVVWDEIHNPYCKYLRELYNSEDYILFIYNVAEYSGGFTLGRQIESMIIESFHKNKNPKNKIYATMENFDSTPFNDLVVGKDIGFMSFNNLDFGDIHNKDMQFSYVKDGQRYFVSLLNSLNFHSGSMSYQSNSILVIKEKSCDENGVFSTIARLTTKGDIASHSYGEDIPVEPSGGKDGYTYHLCELCGHKENVGILHCEGEWITDREATDRLTGIRHKECLDCGIITRSEEIPRITADINYSNLIGQSFNADTVNSIGGFTTAPMTIEAEVLIPADMQERPGVIVGNYDGGNGPQMNLEVYMGGRVRLFFHDGTQKYTYLFNTDIRSDKPVHIAVTIDGNVATLYVNGENTESVTMEATPSAFSTDSFVMGGDNRYGNGAYFKGTIYSLNIFGDVRTEEEIKKDMLLVTSTEHDVLYSFYNVPSDGSAPAEIIDLSGKTFTADTLNRISALSDSPRTIEAVIRLPKTFDDRAGVIVGNYDNSSNQQLNLEVYTKGRIRLFFNNGTQKYSHVFKTDIRSDKPVHIAVTSFANLAFLYVNGVQVEYVTLSAYPFANATENFVVGGDNRKGNDQYFKGTIYSVNMFRESRSANTILHDSYAVSADALHLIYSGYYTENSNFKSNAGMKFSAGNRYYIGENLMTTPKTIEAVVQVPKTLTERAGVITGNYNNSTDPQMNLEVHKNGQVRLFFNNGDQKYSYLFNKDIRSSEPVHIAVTINNNVATLYVDGKLSQSVTMAAAPVANITDGFVIGSDRRTVNDIYFRGTIYSVQMFSDVRTGQEILQDAVLVTGNEPDLMSSTYLANSRCLLGSTHTNHIESDMIVDYPETGYLGGISHTECTLCGEYMSIRELPATDASSVSSVDYNGATGISFYDTNSSVDISDKLSSKPLTVEAMIQLDKDLSERAGVLLGNYDGSANDQINFEIYTNGQPRIYFKSGGTAHTYLFQTDIRSDKMTHMAITINDLSAKLYLDGELKETITMTAKLPDVSNNFRIGSDNRTTSMPYFRGTVYSVSVFSYARTESDIALDRILVPENSQGLMYSEHFLR